MGGKRTGWEEIMCVEKGLDGLDFTVGVQWDGVRMGWEWSD